MNEPFVVAAGSVLLSWAVIGAGGLHGVVRHHPDHVQETRQQLQAEVENANPETWQRVSKNTPTAAENCFLWWLRSNNTLYTYLTLIFFEYMETLLCFSSCKHLIRLDFVVINVIVLCFTRPCAAAFLPRRTLPDPLTWSLVFDEEKLQTLLEGVLVHIKLYLHPNGEERDRKCHTQGAERVFVQAVYEQHIRMKKHILNIHHVVLLIICPGRVW